MKQAHTDECQFSFIHVFGRMKVETSNVHIRCSLITSTSYQSTVLFASRTETVPEWAITEEHNSDG